MSYAKAMKHHNNIKKCKKVAQGNARITADINRATAITNALPALTHDEKKQHFWNTFIEKENELVFPIYVRQYCGGYYFLCKSNDFMGNEISTKEALKEYYQNYI